MGMSILVHTVREAARRFGERSAFVDQTGARLTYAALDRRSDIAATRLRADGVGYGSVVALQLDSTFDYVVTYVAAAKLGAAASGINPSLAPSEQAALIERLNPDAVIEEAIPDDEGGDKASIPDLNEDPERIVAIVFTSGTTGLPRGAIFRDRQLRAVCEADLGPGWEDRWDGGGHMLASTQFAHVGFMTKLPWYLRTGTTTHVLGRWRSGDVLRTVAEHRIATLGVVAPQLALLLRDPSLAELDVSCVERIIAGGAASPPALVRAARQTFGAQYSIRYSSTESGGVGLGTAFDAPDVEALYTVGRPRPGVDVRIVDDALDDLADDATGELLLRTPTMFDGYWRDPEATSATLVDGWIRTGDLASRDATGLVTIRGRVKEMYIRGGYNVAPAEVEAVLGDHPDVSAIAIVPRPDEVMGEVGVAVVVARPDAAPPSLNELRSFGAERLARWKLPEALVVVDDLPLTTMQKLDRAALSATIHGADPVDRVGSSETGERSGR